MNTTHPVETSTTYVPSTVVTVVAEQFGTVCSAPHKRNDERTNVTEPASPAGTSPGRSFATGSNTIGMFNGPDLMSSIVIGAGGGTTVTATVDVATRP